MDMQQEDNCLWLQKQQDTHSKDQSSCGHLRTRPEVPTEQAGLVPVMEDRHRDRWFSVRKDRDRWTPGAN